MLVTFKCNRPGRVEQREFRKEMPIVPREGDYIAIDGTSYGTVKMIWWEIATGDQPATPILLVY